VKNQSLEFSALKARGDLVYKKNSRAAQGVQNPGQGEKRNRIKSRGSKKSKELGKTLFDWFWGGANSHDKPFLSEEITKRVCHEGVLLPPFSILQPVLGRGLRGVARS